MTLPNITVNAVEGSARPIKSAASKPLIIGPASSGTLERKIYTFGKQGDVASTIGYGNAQIAAEIMMSKAPPGFGSVDVIAASGSVAGTITTVSAASPSIDIGGSPNASYDVRVEVTTAGNPGSGKFKYSLDGGNTFSNPVQIPNDNIFNFSNTGISASFSGTNHPEGNKTTVDVQGPGMNTTDLANCFNTLSTSNDNYTVILVADDQRDPKQNLFSRTDTELTTLNDSLYKFTQAVVPVGGETVRENRSPGNERGTYDTTKVIANISGSVAATGNFISPVAERASTQLGIPQTGFATPRLPLAFAYAAEAHSAGSDISLNLASNNVRGVTSISYDEEKDGQVYNSEQIVAPRTFQGEPGYYINQSHLKSGENSTFNIWPKGRITSRAREVVKSAFRPYLHSRVRTLTDGTGRIDPRDKKKIEKDIQKELDAVLINTRNGAGTNGHATSVNFSVNGENDLLATEELQGSVIIVPFAYPSTITVNIALGRVNPT